MEYPTAATGVRAQGADRVRSASLGNPKGGSRAAGRPKPEIKVTIEGDRPPRLGGDVVSFEDMREFLVAYPEDEQQMHITHQDGRDRVLAKTRDLVHSPTQTMVAVVFYYGKPWVDLPEEELPKGLKMFDVIAIQQTSEEDFSARY